MTTQGTWREAVDEVWQLFKETDERLDKRIEETDARLDKRFEETDKKISELSGLFTSQWGKMVEALVEPTALELFQKRGISVNYTYRRVEAKVGGKTMELDILLENSDEVVVIEVKSTLRVHSVRDFLETLKEFPGFFPRYQGYKIYGGVAGLDVEEDADKYAYRQGLFVLSATGDGIAQIKNDADFRPKDFGKN
ncbi:MAG: hypothetical protein MAG431_00158 [Chloroflexi bacterium]|nr:hypothetical protein [Chloroflexota bacterium]